MKNRRLYRLSLSGLKKLFAADFPEIVNMALSSAGDEDFKKKLLEYVITYSKADIKQREHFSLLIDNDGKNIFELSTGENMRVNTISVFRRVLRGGFVGDGYVDLLLDLYYQFRFLQNTGISVVPVDTEKRWMSRWSSGLDENVMQVRAENKERIMHLLVRKIENRYSENARYRFSEKMEYNEKLGLVKEWWRDFRFHLSMAVKSPSELNRFLDFSLSEETLDILNKAQRKGMPFFVTPYYLSLLDVSGNHYDDKAIRSYVLYSEKLVETYGRIRAWEREDIVQEGKPNAAGWFVPDGHNIHRRYPDVAIFIPDSIGRSCGGLCASCQRMYDFQNKRLNFEFESLKPKETWDKKLRKLMKYFEEDTQIRDVLITGGDALMSQNKTLRNILDAVYKMAKRKKEANLTRSEGEKFAELQRVRLGSRLLAYLPMRIGDELIAILSEFRKKASEIGVTQFVIQTHFQSPLEITPEAEQAINKILATGWIITNQLVFTVAASRRGHTAQLRRKLNQLGVICYYTFTVKGFDENYTVFTPNSRSLQEQYEEKQWGMMTAEQQTELYTLINGGNVTAKSIRQFMRKYRLPFLATDRNVLNLPGIGKSMTFVTIGITADGRRILRFEHDRGRSHSPIIDKMGDVYIVENKSIRAYLRQLEDMGENPDNYRSIWFYTQGVTESRFKGYEYPEFDFRVTEHFSNLDAC